MTFVLTVDDALVDIDYLWEQLLATLTPPDTEPALTACALTVALRLGVDHPGLARVLLARLEREADTHPEVWIAPEEIEAAFKELLHDIIASARVPV